MTGFPRKVRDAVKERSGGCCEYCGCPLDDVPASLHHRRPRGMGGTKDPLANSPANALVLCGSGTTGCHGRFEYARALAMAKGVIVSRYAGDPAHTLFTDAAGVSWRLDHEGGKLAISKRGYGAEV